MIQILNDVFGTNLKIVKYDNINDLPVYMIANRNIYKAIEDDISFIIVEINDDNIDLKSLINQKSKYEKFLSLPIVFYFNNMNRSIRNSLIRNHISFITSNSQVFIPFIGMHITNSFNNKKNINNKKMMPITQSLFLYMLYICKDSKVIKKDVAKYLNTTKMSITRASEQLESMNILYQERKGKELYMYTKVYGYELFKLAKEFLINPVQETITVEYTKQIDSFPLANESALSKISMLNKPRRKSVAVNKIQMKKYIFNLVDDKWNNNNDIVNIEKWKYDPNIFSQNNIVDPVSLYMSFSFNNDERIEAELNNLLKEKL